MVFRRVFRITVRVTALSCCVCAYALSAEVRVGLVGASNRGEHILEAGSRMPGLFSEDGRGRGSRITYRRDFNYGGFELQHQLGRWRYGLSFATTGWYVNSGGTRDEDFYMTVVSGVQQGGYNPASNRFYDSAHTFTGTRNFADAEARSTISEYSVHLPLRYYLNRPDEGLFLLSGLRYTYFDFFVYDVVQFVDTEPVVLAPIGEGLRFANAATEVHAGAGYFFPFEATGVGLEISAYGLGGANRARDFHIQRALNFVVYEAYGSGFGYNLSLVYRPAPSLRLRAGLYGHRYYSRGLMRTTGGVARDDIISTFSGPFTVWINTKEAGGELAVMYVY